MGRRPSRRPRKQRQSQTGDREGESRGAWIIRTRRSTEQVYRPRVSVSYVSGPAEESALLQTPRFQRRESVVKSDHTSAFDLDAENAARSGARSNQTGSEGSSPGAGCASRTQGGSQVPGACPHTRVSKEGGGHRARGPSGTRDTLQGHRAGTVGAAALLGWTVGVMA